MPLIKVPHKEWITFIEDFSRSHHRWYASLIQRATEGDHLIAENMPLTGVAIITDDKNGNSLVITLGEGPDNMFRHVLKGPVGISYEETESGAHNALNIECKDGSFTVLKFRSAARPEMLDGLVP